MNPFPYTKTPTTILEAQNNLNHWWFEGMKCPEDVIEAHWQTFIREMKRDATRDMKNLLTTQKESSKV
jgi:predicted kinase